MVTLTLIAAASCGGDDLYDACGSDSDCSAPDGKTPVCVKPDTEGFCSWSCSVDGDCKGDDDVVRICASYESTSGVYCFPSCENGAACPEGFSCRSTGGGSKNRKVCYPG
jgi:hypothetical protein